MASSGYAPARALANYVSGAAPRKSGAELQAGTDFPVVCETCLGPNPYVRMVKMQFGDKLCKISNMPYQPFRWKAGAQGRFKETIVSREVALEKNICQACLVDMTYGVPVGVRDALLASQPGQAMVEARSEANQMYHYGQLAAQVDGGHADGGARVQALEPSRQLLQLARSIQAQDAKSDGAAFRNLPKLCSFWVAGTCTRVLNGRCPFRPCCGIFKFPELAGSQPEMCASLVDALRADGAAKVMAGLDVATRQALKESQLGSRDDAIRRRAMGEDDLSEKYVGDEAQALSLSLSLSQARTTSPRSTSAARATWPRSRTRTTRTSPRSGSAGSSPSSA